MKLNSSFKEINQSPLHKLFTACKGQLVLLVLRVSFTLFNLQGTQRVALNHRCYILAHLVSLVKCFFRNFSAPAPSFKPFALARNSFILPRSFELVKNFFRASQPLFRPVIPFSVLFFTSPVRSGELIQFTTLALVCQALFSAPTRKSVRLPPGLFQLLPLFSCPPHRRSDIIPDHLPIVNPFFTFFCGTSCLDAQRPVAVCAKM